MIYIYIYMCVCVDIYAYIHIYVYVYVCIQLCINISNLISNISKVHNDVGTYYLRYNVFELCLAQFKYIVAKVVA